MTSLREPEQKKETQTKTHIETSLCFEKELADGRLYRIQDKHQMTRGESEEKRDSDKNTDRDKLVDQR